ncbi:hypothetical protein ACLB2K_063845 [Fragaria x ananassa]
MKRQRLYSKKLIHTEIQGLALPSRGAAKSRCCPVIEVDLAVVESSVREARCAAEWMAREAKCAAESTVREARCAAESTMRCAVKSMTRKASCAAKSTAREAR